MIRYLFKKSENWVLETDGTNSLLQFAMKFSKFWSQISLIFLLYNFMSHVCISKSGSVTPRLFTGIWKDSWKGYSEKSGEFKDSEKCYPGMHFLTLSTIFAFLRITENI